MSWGFILLIILILFLIGAFPAWPHSREWGWNPMGVIAVILIILIALMFFGHIPPAWGQEVVIEEPIMVVEDSTVVDEVGDRVTDIVVLVIGGLAAWLTKLLTDVVKSYLGAAAAKLITGALERAVAAGVASGRGVVEGGVEYLKDQLPDEIKKLKLSEGQLQNLVAAEAAKPLTQPQQAPEGRILR